MVLQNYVTSLRHYISATTVRMASKPVRVVNLQGHVTKVKLYLQCLWPPNLAGWWFISILLHDP